MSAPQQTNEEVRSRYIEKMGLELGELFHVTSRELSWVHWRWHQYRVLFADEPSRIDLLNKVAGFFFLIIHDVLFEATLLGISRLTGPAETLGKANLSIERFLPLLSDTNFRNEVNLLIDMAKDSAVFAKDWRNRQLAHRDLNLVLGKSEQALEIATREKIEKSLSALRNVLNKIEGHYCEDAQTWYDYSPGGWDAKALLYALRDGLLRRRERYEQWNRGQPHQDDVQPPGEI